MTYAMAPPEHQEPTESPTVVRLRQRDRQEEDARRQREQYQVGRNEIFHSTGFLKHGVSEWRPTGVTFDLGGGPSEAATPDRAMFRSLVAKVPAAAPAPAPAPEPEPESLGPGLTTASAKRREVVSGGHSASRSLHTQFSAKLEQSRQKQHNRPPVCIPLHQILEVRRGLGSAALGHSDDTGIASLSREGLDFTVAYEIPDPEATEDMTPVRCELRLRAASIQEADCWYDCLESARVMQHAAARFPAQTDTRPLGDSSPTLNISGRSSRRRDPEASHNAIAAAGGMDELQAEIERMRKQASAPRGASASSAIAAGPTHHPENLPSTSSAQTMLRRATSAEERKPTVDPWGRPMFSDADSYRPPGTLDPERGQLLWLKPSSTAAAFDLGQPYGTDYRLHDKTRHECGSTVTGRTFDIGRPFQQTTVFVGQKPRAAKGKSPRRRRKVMPAATGLGLESDEVETPEQVVQEIMSDPLRVEQLRTFAASHVEKFVDEAVISELSGDTEDGRVHYVVKQIKPRKIVIPMEQIEVGIKDSRQGIYIIAEDLELRTEEFRFEITGQKGLAARLVNDQGSALAGCEELGVEVRFDVEIDDSTGWPRAKNAEAIVAVGPLELNITAAKNKRSLNAITR